MLKKLVGVGFLFPFVIFSTGLNIDNLNLSQRELQIFIKAYQLGRQDALQDLNYFERKTLSYLKDIYITKKLIKAGDIRIELKTKIEPIGNNQFQVVKVYEFKIIKPEEIAKDIAFLKRLEDKAKTFRNYEGYWLYIKISNTPEPLQGLIEYALLKEGLKPHRIGDVLVANIFTSEADAKMWQKLLKEKYGLDFAIGRVINGEATDPVIQSILNTLN